MPDGMSPLNPSGDGDPALVGQDGTRRDFFTTMSSAAMAGGMVLGYGTFVAWGGRFLFPAGRSPTWLFVSTIADLKPGDSIAYESPSGVRVVVARKTESRADAQAAAEDFISLSSVCPHLGCRVHWEAQNKRFFCPCHNGEFDADGVATGGPPAVNRQSLKRYELLVENGLIFIQLPAANLDGDRRHSQLAEASPALGPDGLDGEGRAAAERSSGSEQPGREFDKPSWEIA